MAHHHLASMEFSSEHGLHPEARRFSLLRCQARSSIPTSYTAMSSATRLFPPYCRSFPRSHTHSIYVLFILTLWHITTLISFLRGCTYGGAHDWHNSVRMGSNFGYAQRSLFVGRETVRWVWCSVNVTICFGIFYSFRVLLSFLVVCGFTSVWCMFLLVLNSIMIKLL